jgi:hypothetical protein
VAGGLLAGFCLIGFASRYVMIFQPSTCDVSFSDRNSECRLVVVRMSKIEMPRYTQLTEKIPAILVLYVGKAYGIL